MNKWTIGAISLAAVFTVSMIFAMSSQNTQAAGGPPTKTFLLQESEILTGYGPGLYPFIDTTPKQIVGGHVALVDSTTTCASGGTAPDFLKVIVGDATSALTTLPLTNTGIGSSAGCVFHGDIEPSILGLSSVTDVILSSSTTVTSTNSTLTVTVEVAQ